MSKEVLQKFFPPIANKLQARRVKRLYKRGLTLSNPAPEFNELIYKHPQTPASELVESFAQTFDQQIRDCLTAFLKSFGEKTEIDGCEVDISHSPKTTWNAFDPDLDNCQLQLVAYLQDDEEDEEEQNYHYRLNDSMEFVIDEDCYRPVIVIEIHTILGHLIVDTEDFRDIFGQTLQLAQYLHLLTKAECIMIIPDHTEDSDTLKSIFDSQSNFRPRPRYREGLYKNSDLVEYVQLEYMRTTSLEA